MWKLGQSEYILQVEMVSMEFSKYFFINYLYKKRSESITIGLVNLCSGLFKPYDSCYCFASTFLLKYLLMSSNFPFAEHLI